MVGRSSTDTRIERISFGGPRHFGWLPLPAILMASLLSCFALCQVDADSAPLGYRGGAAPVPVHNEQVALVSEKVDIYVFRTWIYVEAEFNLHNFGPATELLVGFPEVRTEYTSHQPFDPLLVEFTSQVDGQPVPVSFSVSLEENPKLRYYGWHTFHVSIGAGQDTVLRNTYFCPLTNAPSGRQATYVLETGAGWRGKIGEALIAVHPAGGLPLSDIKTWRSRNAYDLAKGDSTIEGNSLIMRLTDIEPTRDDDVQINVRNGYPEKIEMLIGETSPRREGDEVVVNLDPYRVPTLRSGFTVDVVGGRQALPIRSLYMPMRSGNSFKIVLPRGMIPTFGNAVEIWGRLSNGDTTDSDLVFVSATQGRLPVSGGDPSRPTLAIVVGLLCVVAGVALRLIVRSRRGTA